MAKRTATAEQQRPLPSEFPKTSLVSAQLRINVQGDIDKFLRELDDTMDAPDKALFMCAILDGLKKHVEALREDFFKGVAGIQSVMDMVDECQASESKITEFNYMALQLSKSKAPEKLDAKQLVSLLRTSYGKVIDKQLVDAFIDAATQQCEPRKTFKIIQL